MNYIVAICVALITGGLSYIVLNNKIASGLRIFKQSDETEQYTSMTFSSLTMIIASAVLTIVAFFATLKTFGYVSDPISIAKMLVALVVMTGAACFDFREKRIPNVFPLAMIGSAVILLALGVITKQQGALQYIMWNSISAFACGITFFALAFVTGQGVGAGDIKLMFSLALLCGIYPIIGTLFYGVIACSVAVIAALVLKKKTLKESLPFGPFMYVGFILTIFIMKY